MFLETFSFWAAVEPLPEDTRVTLQEKATRAFPSTRFFTAQDNMYVL